MAELTRERLGALRVQAKELLAADRREVLVCAGTGCIAGGSLKIYDYLKSECEKRGLKTRVALRREGGDDAIHFKKSGCHGFCEMGPLLQIEPEGFLYTHVRLEDCDEIIERTILGGEAVERLLYELNGVRYAKHNEIPFYAKQQRVVLENCGTTDAEDIDEYLAHDGYAAFEKALFEMSDEDICREILDSGRRGLSRGQKVGQRPPPAQGQEVCGLQRRRGRPRRVHGPLHHGGQPPLRARGHDDRRTRRRE